MKVYLQMSTCVSWVQFCWMIRAHFCNDAANKICVYELHLHYNFSLTLKLGLMEISHTSESSQCSVAGGGRQGVEGGPGMLCNHKALCNKTAAFCVDAILDDVEPSRNVWAPLCPARFASFKHLKRFAVFFASVIWETEASLCLWLSW